MANKILIGVIIGLVVGIILGLGVSVVIKLPTKTGTGTNNQVQVSGTVTPPSYVTLNTLYFVNLNGTFETSASAANGQYTVLLLGGQSYSIYDSEPYSTSESSDYQPFYLPLGVSTFTENLVPAT